MVSIASGGFDSENNKCSKGTWWEGGEREGPADWHRFGFAADSLVVQREREREKQCEERSACFFVMGRSCLNIACGGRSIRSIIMHIIHYRWLRGFLGLFEYLPLTVACATKGRMKWRFHTYWCFHRSGNVLLPFFLPFFLMSFDKLQVKPIPLTLAL